MVSFSQPSIRHFGKDHTFGVGDHSIVSSWIDCKNDRSVTSIGFRCQRSSSSIDPKIISVYKTIIAKQAHTIMKQRPPNSPPNKFMGEYGNSFGALTECACPILDRINQPHLRIYYEDQVIEAVQRIAKEIISLNLAQTSTLSSSSSTTSSSYVQTSLRSTSMTHSERSINITIFASGGLLGEQILMFRLIEQLKSIDFKGTIKLFLIDRQYEVDIKNASSLSKMILDKNESIPKTLSQISFFEKIYLEDTSQFIKDLSLCLPSTIQIEGAIFESTDAYIQRVQEDDSFRHDLLISADFDDSKLIFSVLKQRTFRRANEFGIALIKDFDKLPKIHKVLATCELIPNIDDKKMPSKLTTTNPSSSSSSTSSSYIKTKKLTILSELEPRFLLSSSSFVKQNPFNWLKPR